MSGMPMRFAAISGLVLLALLTAATGAWSALEGVYGGMSLEATKVGDPLVPGNADGLLKSASLFVAADTPIGPAYLGYGRARDGSNSFYFYLGRPF